MAYGYCRICLISRPFRAHRRCKKCDDYWRRTENERPLRVINRERERLGLASLTEELRDSTLAWLEAEEEREAARAADQRREQRRMNRDLLAHPAYAIFEQIEKNGPCQHCIVDMVPFGRRAIAPARAPGKKHCRACYDYKQRTGVWPPDDVLERRLDQMNEQWVLRASTERPEWVLRSSK